MKKRFPWMIVGCLVPLLFIFLAPVFGFGSGISLFIFILAIFGCHLLMPMHHHEDKNHQYAQPNSETSKNTIHEHQH
jgi:uncharacterized membrane protein